VIQPGKAILDSIRFGTRNMAAFTYLEQDLRKTRGSAGSRSHRMMTLPLKT